MESFEAASCSELEADISLFSEDYFGERVEEKDCSSAECSEIESSGEEEILA